MISSYTSRQFQQLGIWTVFFFIGDRNQAKKYSYSLRLSEDSKGCERISSLSGLVRFIIDFTHIRQTIVESNAEVKVMVRIRAFDGVRTRTWIFVELLHQVDLDLEVDLHSNWIQQLKLKRIKIWMIIIIIFH